MLIGDASRLVCDQVGGYFPVLERWDVERQASEDIPGSSWRVTDGAEYRTCVVGSAHDKSIREVVHNDVTGSRERESMRGTEGKEGKEEIGSGTCHLNTVRCDANRIERFKNGKPVRGSLWGSCKILSDRMICESPTRASRGKARHAEDGDEEERGRGGRGSKGLICDCWPYERSVPSRWTGIDQHYEKLSSR